MFDFDLKKLKRAELEAGEKSILTVTIKIFKWDTTPGKRKCDEQGFVDWLHTGCRQFSDGNYKIEKV